MRYAPAQSIVAPHEVSADVMQAWLAASAWRGRFGLCLTVGGQERCAHLDMLGELHAAVFSAVPIQALKLARPLRQARASREQQKKSQQYRYREGHDADGLMQNLFLLRG
jgi:hypothetical protein